jgi:hypothetical protein
VTDQEVLREVDQALQDAFEASKRKGKWSTVSEIKVYDDAATLKTLRELVKEGAATEKTHGAVKYQMFKPSRGLAGPDDTLSPVHAPQRGQVGGGDSDRGQDQGGDRGQDSGKYPDKTDRGGSPWDAPKKGDRGNTGEVVSRGVGTMLVGGMGSSAGATPAGVPLSPRVVQ